MAEPRITIIEGNLLEADADYIAHQCNCCSVSGRGLAQALFKAYPDADIYRNRKAPDEPGHCVVRGRVINMLAQFGPGKPSRLFDNYGRSAGRSDTAKDREAWFRFRIHIHTYICAGRSDTAKDREAWFRECLSEMETLLPSSTRRVAFPYLIGCGLAGGKWENYQAMLEEFARTVPFEVVLLKLPGTRS